MGAGPGFARGARRLRGVLASRGLRWPRRLFAAVACVIAAWWVAVLAGDFPVGRLERVRASSLELVDASGSLLRQEATSAGTMENWVPLGDVSEHLIHATLASEDNEFYDHSGVDWTALGRASWLNLRGREISYGGSTITMQLVRLTAGTKRNLAGKLRQMVLSARLERQLSKHEILEHYLNRIYYGNGAWGAQEAAQRYFGKTAAELSLGESAFLAVLPRGPSYYDPMRHWHRTIERRSHILELMERHGYIEREDRELAERAPIALKSAARSFRAPHFVEFAKSTVPRDMRAGSRIETTLDLRLQERIEVAVDNHIAGLKGRNLTQAAVVVMRNDDGAILAMVGSKDYFDRRADGAFNGATAVLRPGSTLKPFVYGAAIERGHTPATIAYDLPLPADANQFYTKDVKSHGPARYREALAGSYNLSAVHALQDVGLPLVLRKLRASGLHTLDEPDEHYDWGLAIGHAKVRLVDLVGAFSTFGRGGRPVAPRAVERVVRVDGHEWRPREVRRDRVFDPAVAYQIYDILSDPEARLPMFGDRVPMNLPFEVAVKTGTTKAYTDLWAIGVTREFTVGVWAGNFDGSPTRQVMSVQGATPLLRAAYSAVAARYGEPTSPDRPDNVVSAEVCPISGKRPGPFCGHHKVEIFTAGSEPDETCDWHQVVCGERAVVYPAEARAWAQLEGRTRDCRREGATAGPVRIVAPVEGARFVLEDHRSAEMQRPPIAAYPSGGASRWTVNGVPLDDWIPSRGRHRVRVERGEFADEVSIVYE